MTSKGMMRFFATLFLTALLLSVGQNILAQDATGKIVGTITDQQGAVIAGAKVTATNTATQVSRDAVTSKDGYFEVLLLPIGNYKVIVEKDGFKKAVSDEQKLQINQSLRLDISMQAGGANELIDVTAQAAVIETVNPTLGQSITDRPIVNMPLNGRNVLSLALLQPGVTETTVGQFSIAGGRGDSVTFLLDGGMNNNLLNNGVVYNPNPDTIAEFRLLTSNYTAEYGRNGGGIISVVTKSGGNAYHGTVFEFLRNDALNANSFFNKNDPNNLKPRPLLKRNQFGFTAGGPISIPHVVNGKDRFFFFVGYQGQRQVATQSSTITTFSPLEIKGDFSQTTTPGVKNTVMDFLLRTPFFQPNAALAAQGIMDPSKIDPVTQKYIAAHLIPTSIAPGGKLTSTGGSLTNNDELTLKFDVNVTSKDKLSMTYGAFRNPNLNPFPSSAPGFPNTTLNHRYFANMAYTRVFTPTMINEFRFTAQRNNNFQSVPAATLPKPNDLGVGIISDNPTGPTNLSLSGAFTTGFSVQGPTALIDDTFAFSDTVSWVRNAHTFKFGAYYSPYENNTVFDFFINGSFSFTGRGTQNTAAPTTNCTADPVNCRTTSSLLDFLVGAPRSYTQFPAAPSNIRTKSTSLFAQDEWKLRRNLTLTLGLRYEYNTPKLDTKGRSFSLALGQQSTVFTKAPLGELFPGDKGAPKGANFPDKNDFAPRVGFAWAPGEDGKTSVRGGIGVFYDILKGEDNLQFNGQAPFFGFAGFSYGRVSAATAAPLTLFSNPFQSNPNPFPSKPPASNVDFAAAGFLPVGDGGVFFVDPHLRTPYTYQYNLSVQREITRSLVVEASYVGNSSHKLTALVDRNPFVLGDPNLERVFNAQPGVAGDTFSFTPEFRNVGVGIYNSFELSVNKKLSSEGRFGSSYLTFAYTYAHGIDTASGFRDRNSQVPFYNTKQFRASSDFDLRHRISFSGGWDLPFDRAWDSGPKRLTSGWSIYPIITYRTGFPLDVFAGSLFATSQDVPGPSGAGDASLVHANLVGNSVGLFDPHLVQTFGTAQGNFYFNPANFSSAGLDAQGNAAVTNPALRTYGTLPRNFFRGPGRFNFDFAAAKTTSLINERLKLEFRAEFFNIFNSVQFNNPSTNISNQLLFGQVTTDAGPRILQFALRLSF